MDKNATLAAIKEFLIPYSTCLLGPFLAQKPEWELAWYSAIGLYGVYMQYNQDKVNDVVEFIEANPQYLAGPIVESQEFKEAFTIFIDAFFKQRGEEKRGVIKQIFLGYSQNPGKDFELEKFYSKLEQMSYQDVLALKYIADHQIPSLADKWKENYRSSTKPHSESEEEYVAGILQRGIDVKQGGFDEAKMSALGMSSKDFYESLDSLANLGILTKMYSSYIGGGSTDYLTNRFGLKFIQFIKNSGSHFTTLTNS